MCNSISNSKNLISSNNCVNVNKKNYIIYVLCVIFAILIFMNNYKSNTYMVYASSVVNEEFDTTNIEQELKDGASGILDDINFSVFDDLVKDSINLEIDGVDDLSFKEFVQGLVDGDIGLDSIDFFKIIKTQFIGVINEILPLLLLIMVIILLCNIINFFKSDRVSSSLSEIIYFFALSIIIIVVSVLLKNVVDKCYGTIDNLHKQINVIFPIVLSILTTIGATSTVATYSPVLTFFSTSFVNIFKAVLFPIFTFLILITVVSKLTKNNKLSKMKMFFSSVYKWILGSVSSIFVTFLSFQGITAGVKDGLSIKAAKFAIKNYIPFLGGYISQGYDVIKIGGVLVKNALGYSSVILLIFTIMSPIIHICILSLGLKLISATCDIVDNIGLSSFLYDIANILNYLIAIIVGVACMYFFIIFLLIATGNAVL